ncbi:MAG: fibronectin type III domain-containing protein [Fimbriimonadaceae bacterium]
MAKYPTRKADKENLYDDMVAGIAANPTEYPSGLGEPFDTGVLVGLITAKNNASNTRQADESQFRLSVEAEGDTFDAVDEEARRLLNLAIATHGVKSNNLTLIGWGPTGTGTSNLPGQPRTLEAQSQLPSSCFLDWKAPAPAAGAGRVGFYRVERRVRTLAGAQTEDWGAWQLTPIESEITVTGLERGVEYDFRVIAVNAAGDSVPSNTVTLVL